MIGLLPLAIAALAYSAFATASGFADGAVLGPICAAVSRQTSLWTFDSWVAAPLLASASLYLGGLAALWGRVGIGRGVGFWQAFAFAGGWLALAGALVSPLHRFGGQLFTWHMVEHELVMAVAAPLLVLARPAAAFLWAFPGPVRLLVGRTLRARTARAVWAGLTRPLTATALHAAAIWAWHIPALFDDAVLNVALHRVQHASFLGTALLFWWAVLRRADFGSACGHVFATLIHTSLLGALLALAPHVLFRVQTAHAPAWGLSPLEDQQLAGLVMWVPAGMVYVGAALALVAVGIRRSSRPAWEVNDAVRRPL